MISQQDHIIRRVTLELDIFAQQSQAFKLQSDIKRMIMEEVTNELDFTFSHAKSSEQIIRFNKINLDLGRVSRREFKERLLEELEKQVNISFQSIGGVDDIRSGQLFEESQKEDLLANPVSIRGQNERNIALFFHFLRSGTFPWWAKKIIWENWEKDLSRQLEVGKNKFPLNKLVTLLREEPRHLDRLVWQFSPFLLERVVDLVSKSIKLRVRKDPKLLSNGKKIRKVSPSGLSTRKSKIKEQLQSLIIDAKPDSIISTDKSWTGSGRGLKRNTEANQGSSSKVNSKQNSKNLAIDNSIDPRTWELQLAGQTSNLEQEEAFFINNAGLALLLPCMVYLYQELGYLKPEMLFKSPSKQLRAIHLLQYIVFGKTPGAEPDMLLNKIACGWPIEEPVKKNIRITKLEKEKSDAYLQMLIDRWGALKKTFPDGLRYNFLMRNGKLSFHNGHWLLQVEKTGYDSFLMDKLPWTISIIKNKWMKNRIHVEWIN